MNQYLLPALAALLLTACSSQAGNEAAGRNESETGAEPFVVAADVPDACTFIPKAELEAAVGWELRDGEPQSVSDASESQCEFKRQLGTRATKTFPNPAIPSTVGLTSVTISTSPADPEAVAQVRELDPTAFVSVQGLGDDAYFLGPNLLHVRAGSRSFSVRVNPEAQSSGDQAKVREVMLALARSGVSRLRQKTKQVKNNLTS